MPITFASITYPEADVYNPQPEAVTYGVDSQTITDFYPNFGGTLTYTITQTDTAGDVQIVESQGGPTPEILNTYQGYLTGYYDGGAFTVENYLANGQYLYFLWLFTASPDTSGSITLYDDGSGAPFVACYVAGTAILSDRGQVAVETLLPGDRIVTASGERRSVRWVGHRAYSGRFLRANRSLWPVCFRAGSLGQGLPQRDLLVSPEHAMFIDGILISARCLVNGTTVIQRPGLGQVDYYHVELDSHDVLLAEGVASESYADDGNRCLFHNAAGYDGPRADVGSAVYCAPRVTSGYALERVRQRLAAIAASTLALTPMFKQTPA